MELAEPPSGKTLVKSRLMRRGRVSNHLPGGAPRDLEVGCEDLSFVQSLVSALPVKRRSSLWRSFSMPCKRMLSGRPWRRAKAVGPRPLATARLRGVRELARNGAPEVRYAGAPATPRPGLAPQSWDAVRCDPGPLPSAPPLLSSFSRNSSCSSVYHDARPSIWSASIFAESPHSEDALSEWELDAPVKAPPPAGWQRAVQPLILCKDRTSASLVGLEPMWPEHVSARMTGTLERAAACHERLASFAAQFPSTTALPELAVD